MVRRIAATLPASPQTGGPDVPLVLDEPLAGLSESELAEALDRIEESPRQVVYLTEDPAVAAWARPRSAADQVALIAFDG